MNKTSIIGIDLAKNVFQLHGADRFGKRTFTKRLKRHELASYITQLQPATIGIEACSGAHYWGRLFKEAGHKVKIIHPAYVKSFVRVNKNDMRDAEGIAEAASRESIPVVAHKSVEQLDLQAVHRVRERVVKQKTAIGNELRGLLAEQGVVFPVGNAAIKNTLPRLLEDAELDLSYRCRRVVSELRDEWCDTCERIAKYDDELKQIAKENAHCARLMTILGIGPIVATLLYSYAGNGSAYASSRHFAASIGLVPGQHSSGGKDRMLGISKRGNKHLRKQLVHGARAAYNALVKKPQDSRLGRWIASMGDKHPNKIVVALANKLARIAWACLVRETEYRAN